MELKFQNTARMQQLLHSGRTLVAVDTETTGLSAKRNHVIEIGAARFDEQGIKGEPFSSLVRCPVPLHPFITGLTGITDAMLESAPSADQVMPRFLEFVGGDDAVFVAHNARFDMSFLNATLERTGLPPLANDFVDTLHLARLFLPALRKTDVEHPYSLQNLIHMLGIESDKAHRAYSDAVSCAKIFLKLALSSPAVATASLNSAI